MQGWPGWHACLIAIALPACGDGQVEVAPCADLTALVAGEAQAALHPVSCFALAVPTARRARLEQPAATTIAQAFATQFVPLLIAFLERGHEAPIVPQDLTVCGPAYYAESGFVEPAPTTLAADQSVYGPFWVLALCNGDGQPHVSLGIAAYATYLTVAGGQIQWPPSDREVFGNEFRIAAGIPAHWAGALAASPEEAVRFVHALTGLRTVMVPRLVLRDPAAGVAQSALWTVVIEALVRTRNLRTGVERFTDTLFVGLPEDYAGASGSAARAVLHLASDEQPRAGTAGVYATYEAYLAGGPRDSVYREAGRPVRFDRAEVSR